MATDYKIKKPLLSEWSNFFEISLWVTVFSHMVQSLPEDCAKITVEITTGVLSFASFSLGLRATWQIFLLKNQSGDMSDQDGSIGRHSSPPGTSTSKLQITYRTTVTRNCQKLN